MQDIVVYISLDTASKEKETLRPLILSFEGEFAYKEYNSVEAVIGALYLDQGIEAVKTFLEENLLVKLDDILKQKLYRDPKSSLQEEVQALGFETPVYVVLDESGPDHDKSFTVAVQVGDRQLGHGSGKSKQLAQQAAAEQALKSRLYKNYQV